jgi:hypothetical protein
MRRSEALQIITRLLKQPVEDVAAAELIYGRALPHIEAPGPQAPQPWAMQVDVLAARIAAELYRDGEEASPVAQADDAKRRRDLVGEIHALTAGYDRLTNAPWYPARPGDLVHVHYEQIGDTAAFGETYVVGPARHGFLSLQLLAHSLPSGVEPDDFGVGCFAVEDDPDPLTDVWMEAGPQRLTIVRDGHPVHVGGAR